MGEYRSRLTSPGGGGSFSFGAREELSLLDAFKERYQRPGSPALKVLSTLAIPSQIVASMVRESVERAQDPYMPETSMGQAALRGIADPETSYGDIPGVGTKTGLALDITADPLWFAPTKVINAPLRLAAGGAKALGKTALKVPQIDYAVARVAQKVVPNYAKSRAGFKGYDEAVEIPARMGENEVHYQLDKIAEDIYKLVPDDDRARHVLELAELAGPADIPAPQIAAEIARLTTAERKAFDKARAGTKMGEDIRVEHGAISEATARNFEERTGLAYFQRVTGRREDIIADLDMSLQSGRWQGEQLETLQRARESIAAADDVPLDSYTKELERAFNEGRVPRDSFTRYRDVGKSIRGLRESDDALDQIAYAMAEKNVARVMRVQSTATSRAVYRKIYLDGWKDYAEKMGVLFPEEEAHKAFVGKSRHMRFRGDTELVPIADIPELAGYVAPRVLAQDLKDVLMSPLDPEAVKRSVGLLRATNKFWRGWALAAPMTHMRNLIDTWVWRNAAGGMNPQDVNHLAKSFQIRKDVANGTLSKADEKIWRRMVRAGIARSNQFVEQDIMMGAKSLDAKSVIRRWMDPKTSPPVRKMYDFGGFAEDVGRGAMFLWRESKGDNIVQASKYVNKWHIDYRYGLTPWERNLRDTLIPFWTFTSRNMPLTLETIVQRPKLLAAAGHANEAVEDIFGGPEPDFPLSGWMQSATPLRLAYNKEKDTYYFAALDGLWSFTDVNKIVPGRMMDELINMISPIVKAPYEVIQNHKLFPAARKGYQIERPGDKFFGTVDFPFDKRLEYVFRLWRPINEADRWIEAYSRKYSDSTVERFANVAGRILIGKTYPTTKEEQLRWYKAGTNEQLRSIRRAKKIAHEAGDTEMEESMAEQERAIIDARKELGIK